MHTVPKLDQQFNDFMGFCEHLSDSIGLSFNFKMATTALYIMVLENGAPRSKEVGGWLRPLIRRILP